MNDNFWVVLFGFLFPAIISIVTMIIGHLGLRYKASAEHVDQLEKRIRDIEKDEEDCREDRAKLIRKNAEIELKLLEANKRSIDFKLEENTSLTQVVKNNVDVVLKKLADISSDPDGFVKMVDKLRERGLSESEIATVMQHHKVKTQIA